MENKVNPHELPEGSYTCRFTESGKDQRIRVHDEPEIGRIVQLYDERNDCWYPAFYPKEPCQAVFVVSTPQGPKNLDAVGRENVERINLLSWIAEIELLI